MMDPVADGPNDAAAAPVAAPAPAARRQAPSRRSRWIGSIVALLVLAGVGWLAWQLTHRAPDVAGGAPGGGGGPGGGAPGGGAGGGAGGAGGAAGRRGAPPTTVGVATAEQADLPVIVEALGTVTPAATATVRPQVSGVLQKLLFREGQMVRAGQLLAQIDPRPFELTLMQATGQRQRDEAQLTNARLTLERYRTLLQQDSIARQDVDTQAALVQQLEGTLTTDRANEGTARLNLGYARVVAPISGRLGLRVVDAGNVVSSGDANGLAVITQLAPIDVEFSLPQDRVPELQARLANAGGTSTTAPAARAAGSDNAEMARNAQTPRQAARGAARRASAAAEPASGGRGNTAPADRGAMPVTALDRTRSAKLATGRFLALDNVVDTQTGTVRAKARFANDPLSLFPSQFVNAQLLLRTIRGAVVVPVAALRHGNDGDYVYVLNSADRTVAQRPVTRGEATADKVQIAKGLQAGEQVITEGGDRLKDGARVVLPGDRPASGAASGGRRGERGSSAASGSSGASGASAASGAASGGRRGGRAAEAAPA